MDYAWYNPRADAWTEHLAEEREKPSFQRDQWGQESQKVEFVEEDVAEQRLYSVC